MLKANTRQSGFTLAEVLVALVVVSVSFLALVEVAGTHTRNAGYLRDKTFAHWVAANQIAQVQVLKSFPKVGQSKGEAEMGDRTWFWEQKIEGTPDPKLRRIEVVVKAEKKTDKIITQLVGFVAEQDAPAQNTGPPS